MENPQFGATPLILMKLGSTVMFHSAQVGEINTLVKYFILNLLKLMKIAKNSSLVLLYYTFAMYRPRVHSINQRWGLWIKRDGCTSWSIQSIASYLCTHKGSFWIANNKSLKNQFPLLLLSPTKKHNWKTNPVEHFFLACG